MTSLHVLADMKGNWDKLTGWLNERIRMYYWKGWKRIRTKFAKMVKLGIEKVQAIPWANSRKGYQRCSKSFLLIVLENDYLNKEGYPNLIGNKWKHIKVGRKRGMR